MDVPRPGNGGLQVRISSGADDEAIVRVGVVGESSFVVASIDGLEEASDSFRVGLGLHKTTSRQQRGGPAQKLGAGGDEVEEHVARNRTRAIDERKEIERGMFPARDAIRYD